MSLAGAGTIAARLTRAAQIRWLLMGPSRSGSVRLFAGDSEGLPGVTVDRHGEFVVVQWLSAGALPWRDELLDAIEAAVQPRGIYEQRRVRPLAGQPPPEPAVRARGDEAPIELVVEEAGCRYGIDVTAPSRRGAVSRPAPGTGRRRRARREPTGAEPLLLYRCLFRRRRQSGCLRGGRRSIWPPRRTRGRDATSSCPAWIP